MSTLKAFIDGDIYQFIVLPYYNATPLPGGNINLLVFSLTLYSAPNGYFILPLLSFATQFLTTKLNPAMQPQADSKAGSGAIMKWMMPIFSIYICATSNAAFALYWVISNVVAMVQQVVFKWYFDNQDRKEAKLQTAGEFA